MPLLLIWPSVSKEVPVPEHEHSCMECGEPVECEPDCPEQPFEQSFCDRCTYRVMAEGGE